MDSLFGGEITGVARFVIAFIIVLALIGISAWLVRRFGRGTLAAAAGRGRQPRLAVIDAASIDARRRLLLVRRDNVEHLLMIGGPSDLVIEPNIIRAVNATRDLPGSRATAIAEAAPRPAIEDSTLWPLQPRPEATPRPEPALRIPRGPVAPSPASASETLFEAAPRAKRTDPDAEIVPPVVSPPPMPVTEPTPIVTPEPELATAGHYATAETDANLAEMAQKMEASLRRPAAVGPEIAAAEPAPAAAPPIELRLHAEADTAAAPAVAPDPIQCSARRPAPSKEFYHNLEQEMASLLGRPTGKT